jgi:uncharacterized protein YciI
MLYAIAAFLKEGAEARLIDYHEEFNEHLGADASNVRIAGALRGPDGHRAGYFALLEGERADADAWIDASPHSRAGLYERVEIYEYDLEVGAIG